ncbi:MAG: energy transducer TonB [Henriciella sp.]
MTRYVLLAAAASLAACESAPPPSTYTGTCIYEPSETSKDDVFARARVGQESRSALEANSQSYVTPNKTYNPEPNYPVGALACAIDADCYVAFDVTVDGRTENAVAACTSRMFETAAVASVYRFIYDPMQVDGKAVASPDHGAVIRFRLAE